MGVADCGSVLCTLYGLGETEVRGCGSLWFRVCVADMCEPTPLYMYKGAYKCI